MMFVKENDNQGNNSTVVPTSENHAKSVFCTPKTSSLPKVLDGLGFLTIDAASRALQHLKAGVKASGLDMLTGTMLQAC